MVRTKRCSSGLVLLGLCVFLGACGTSGPTHSAVPRVAVARNPQLRSIQLDASKILDGGTAAFKARLASLRGHPLVVNQWASWCPPCRREFPYFQRVAARLGNRVAFLGVDSNDSRSDARTFLAKFPTPYPHYYDPDTKIARVFHGGAAWPTTAFYNARGQLIYSHPGAFPDERSLVQDIKRYSLGG